MLIFHTFYWYDGLLCFAAQSKIVVVHFWCKSAPLHVLFGVFFIWVRYVWVCNVHRNLQHPIKNETDDTILALIKYSGCKPFSIIDNFPPWIFFTLLKAVASTDAKESNIKKPFGIWLEKFPVKFNDYDHVPPTNSAPQFKSVKCTVRQNEDKPPKVNNEKDCMFVARTTKQKKNARNTHTLHGWSHALFHSPYIEWSTQNNWCGSNSPESIFSLFILFDFAVLSSLL